MTSKVITVKTVWPYVRMRFSFVENNRQNRTILSNVNEVHNFSRIHMTGDKPYSKTISIFCCPAHTIVPN